MRRPEIPDNGFGELFLGSDMALSDRGFSAGARCQTSDLTPKNTSAPSKMGKANSPFMGQDQVFKQNLEPISNIRKSPWARATWGALPPYTPFFGPTCPICRIRKTFSAPNQEGGVQGVLLLVGPMAQISSRGGNSTSISYF